MTEEIEMRFMRRLPCHHCENQYQSSLFNDNQYQSSLFNDNQYQSSSITSDGTVEEEEKTESGGNLTLNPKMIFRRERRKA
uniref:Uncharacterized protein n=1 Tax=Cucumis melo TaxID=3656 RepID=A0A9I9DIM1_CUCME